ncbi:helix-turn-helix transcriptional regulator [Chitinophaga sancti]|uniref:AraC family transcriptional regulator n=1 Tax=Chitinophaga sancti TaxID=1004 RepID=A0A1K1QZE4_9BACT|nr:AraC family transcriptional regulator [Chitinophaga sancti]WQD62064.1 AraC family transcriptional regulator [Chitinophaga sancti]WQG92367.1 AraC family transcriptional regulator [Chitinophaga sancti]SFW64710.1 AraC-type DNA-binding protein [Chitinophaga sancti]
MDVLHVLARLFGTVVKDRKLEIPEQFGKGYVTRYIFNEQIRMMIMNYELKENMVIDNPEVNAPRNMILFKFQHIFDETEKQPAVLITTTSMNMGPVIPIHTHTSTINIEVDSNYLSALFDQSEKSPVLQSLLENTQPLFFEQVIYPSLQEIVNEIVKTGVKDPFKMFFLRIKAEELVCRLLMELEKREEKHLYALNSRDIQTLYRIKEEMLEHLDTPPVINELAVAANMSPTKLKSLFKQIFGNSIFSYYQECRMKKAAFLLKEGSLSVSDVGYQLGFTNLSHFSRVFQEHIGMKPKQYSRS